MIYAFYSFHFSELSKVKVIDMTGPEQRVLSGYHAISSIQRPSDQWEIRKDKKFVNFELPELQHNLNLLVDMCEEVCYYVLIEPLFNITLENFVLHM